MEYELADCYKIRNLSSAIQAWKERYMAKGCHERKAELLAGERARKLRRGPIIQGA